LESEAKLFVQSKILSDDFELAWSYVIDLENFFNPYDERKKSIARWRDVATVDIDESEEIVELANRIMLKGVKKKDSLHVACAVVAKCQYFLTTDKGILNKKIDGIVLINPIDFVRELEVYK